MSLSSASKATSEPQAWRGRQGAWPLDPRDFSSWHEYYWTYQYQLASIFLIPLMEKWGIQFADARILDVGCGDGGFTAAMAERGAICVGVEIKEFKRKQNNNDRLRYVVQDVTAPDAPKRLGHDYDVVVLRDVIEHIPLDRKENFLVSLKKFLNASGKMFVTFPPFYSPYGLHQQTLLKSKLRSWPYLHYLPAPLLRKAMTMMHEPEVSRAAVEDIARCRMTIRHFKRLMRKTGMQIIHEKYYFVRPSHEIRYGWKTRGAPWGIIPLLRDVLVAGATMLVAPLPN